MRLRNRQFFAALLLIFGAITNVSAGLIVDIFESNGNLQATLTGNLDLSATLGFSDQPNSYDGFVSGAGLVAFNRGRVNSYRLDINAFTPFGASPSIRSWSSSDGDLFAIYGGGFVAVPINYQSGADLSATATLAGSSLAGLSTGSFVSTFRNGVNSDTITIRVGLNNPADPTSVPEPTALALMTLGIAGIGCSKNRKA